MASPFRPSATRYWLSLCPCFLSQLFYLKSPDRAVCAALAMVVDDFLVCGDMHIEKKVLQSIGNKFTLEIIAHGPGTLRQFGPKLVQYDDYSTRSSSTEMTSLME